MTPDMVAELMRQLMRESLLIAAAGLSFLLSLVQTLTSVPRLAAIAMILLVGMPWFLERVANYMRFLMGDFRRFLG
jgi:type III secretory pathway component EscS